MRRALSALILLLAVQGATAAVHQSISPRDFEALLKAHGATISHGNVPNLAHVRVLQQDFDVRYLGCDELRGPDWVCAFSIGQVWPRLHLNPEQVNRINNEMALGRVYIVSTDADGHRRGDVVVDYTVALTGGVTDDYILKSFGEMIQGIADHFESALSEVRAKRGPHASKR